MKPNSSPQRFRRLALHGARVALFCGIILLIRLQHSGVVAGDRATSFPPVERKQLQRLFPTAASVSIAEEASANGKGDCTVVDEEGNPLGYLFQTSPDSDSLVGFSGPTNALVAFGNDDRIVGIDVLSSRDTREHVTQVLQDDAFMNAFAGRSRNEVATLQKIDGVSGATLTSLTIQEAIVMRLSGNRRSLKFTEPPSMEDVQRLLSDAATIKQDEVHPSLWRVSDDSKTELGTILRTSPHADHIVGYQGPTDTLIGFGADGRVVGIAVGKSYDNEEYVTYVRDDKYFLRRFNALMLEQLAEFGDSGTNVEGVSGATMTSMAVADGLVIAAEQLRQSRMNADVSRESLLERLGLRWGWRDLGTAIVIVFGLLIALTSLRGNKAIRIAFQIVLIGYLGLINGDMVSQAMMVGWAANAVPWANAGGLVMLTLAAFLVPMTTRRNAYCTHLCPHGAAQHLLKNRLPWQVRLPRWLTRVLRCIPALLLLWCVVVAMAKWSFSLVDIEPFDAWVFRIAGWATITIAIVGLVASLFVPMAYCRFGCPTGALLNFLRFNSRSDRWSRRDWFAVSLAAVALGIWVAA